MLPSQTYAAALKKKLKASYVLTFSAILIVANIGLFVYPPWGGLVAALILPPYFVWYRRSLVRPLLDLPQAAERLTFRDTTDEQGKQLGWAGIIGFFLLSLLFVGAGVLMLVAEIGSIAMASLTIVLFGLATVVFGYQGFRKFVRRERPAPNSH